MQNMSKLKEVLNNDKIWKELCIIGAITILAGIIVGNLPGSYLNILGGFGLILIGVALIVYNIRDPFKKAN